MLLSLSNNFWNNKTKVKTKNRKEKDNGNLQELV